MNASGRTAADRPGRLRRRTAGAVAALVSGAVVLSGCSVYDAPLPGGADTGDNPMKVKVMFRDVLDLVPQSTVKVNDVTVGKVSSVTLKGYVAEVTVQLPGNVKLPDNATAEIRQTSLLGEKFVSLAPPQDPRGRLGNGDTIGLDRTGRNPEIEEVLSALALLLNGGGVGQLKTIFTELNNTFDGREPQLRSLLTQLRTFVGQLDENKSSIVAAIENTNRLAAEIRKQDTTIKNTLDDVPDALRSINRQRADLVKLLKALARLSGVGVRVIEASKESTINSLRDLAPVLDGFQKAGQNLPKALQVYLTYPFVDEAVGRDPQVARNLHMGDYTNLSLNLDVDLAALKLPGLPGLPTLPTPPDVCAILGQVTSQTRANVRAAAAAAVKAVPPNPLITAKERKQLRKNVVSQMIAPALATATKDCEAVQTAALSPDATKLVPNLLKTLDILTPAQVTKLLDGTLGDTIKNLPDTGTSSGTGSVLGGIVPRAGLGQDFQKSAAQIDPFGLARHGLDPGIGTMLLQGVAEVR